MKKSKSTHSWEYGHHGIIAKESGLKPEQLTSILRNKRTNPSTAQRIKDAAAKLGYTVSYKEIRTIVEIEVVNEPFNTDNADR